MKYQIIKTVEAKSIIDAIRDEMKAKIDSVICIDDDSEQNKIGFE